MNKLDKQFEQLMKGIRIDSPSPDFTFKVMSRIQAEAAVQKRPIIAGYQPVISRKTWIILIAAFILLMVYVTVSSPEASSAKEPGIWSAISDSLQKLDAKGVSGIWQVVSGLFTSIPPIAYIILLASMSLWTLDSFLVMFRHSASHVQIK